VVLDGTGLDSEAGGCVLAVAESALPGALLAGLSAGRDHPVRWVVFDGVDAFW
jgi:hypothetical protein